MHTTTNIVSLDTARTAQSAMASEKPRTHKVIENRSEGRSIIGERMFVQITQAADKELVGKTIACKAVDASASGIKFIAEDFFPVGCSVDLWVDDKTRPGKFFLSGEARWTEKSGPDSTLVGVRLQEGLATDIEGWKEAHEK